MLFVSALTSLVLTAPISVGHLVHTLQLKWTEELMEQSTFMTCFAIADLLAFVQHASQFYVCFACSLCFRQALRRQFVRIEKGIRHILPCHKRVVPIMRGRLAGRPAPMRRLRLPPAHFFQRNVLVQRERRFELRESIATFTS